ncbi:MAG: hypothetical protein M3P08_20325 [Thermoproteota archaeon]|nr:hypothetical protein [Thermoproteota archaeon]
MSTKALSTRNWLKRWLKIGAEEKSKIMVEFNIRSVFGSYLIKGWLMQLLSSFTSIIYK